jgi:hypothetical protein
MSTAASATTAPTGPAATPIRWRAGSHQRPLPRQHRACRPRPVVLRGQGPRRPCRDAPLSRGAEARPALRRDRRPDAAASALCVLQGGLRALCRPGSDPRLPAPGANAEHPYLRGWREHTGSLDLPADWERRARTAYYGLTTAMDRMIAAILDKLDEAGLAQDTLVVYASDHGDQLGERGLWWKQTFYDQSVAIPLVMRWPGRLPEGERRVTGLQPARCRRHHARCAGCPGLAGRAGAEPARRRSSNPNSPWLDETFAEYCTDGVARWTGTAPVQQRMVRSGRFKLVYYHGLAPQLFDLAADPDELVDLAEEPGHRAGQEGPDRPRAGGLGSRRHCAAHVAQDGEQAPAVGLGEGGAAGRAASLGSEDGGQLARRAPS